MTKALMTTEDEVLDYLAHGEEAVVVSDRFESLYLVYSAGGEFSEGELVYQGVPQALDERGREVDANSGRVTALLAKGPLAKVHPVMS